MPAIFILLGLLAVAVPVALWLSVETSDDEPFDDSDALYGNPRSTECE